MAALAGSGSGSTRGTSSTTSNSGISKVTGVGTSGFASATLWTPDNADKLSKSMPNAPSCGLAGFAAASDVGKVVGNSSAKKKSKSIFSGEAILSRVDDGNFSGVNGHSVIKLEDGTVWKQASPDDHFRAQVSNHPPARVSHSTFGYKMHIVGVPEFYVDPVR